MAAVNSPARRGALAAYPHEDVSRILEREARLEGATK